MLDLELFEKFQEFYKREQKVPTKEENLELYTFYRDVLQRNMSYKEWDILQKVQIDLILDEMLEHIKKTHSLASLKKINASIGRAKLYQYYTQFHERRDCLSLDQQQKLNQVLKYATFKDSMIDDIIAFYQENKRVPEEGEKNDLGVDLGKYYHDLTYGQIAITSFSIQKLRKNQIPFKLCGKFTEEEKRITELKAFYEENKKLPTEEENPVLYQFFQDILQKKVQFHYKLEGFSTFQTFKIGYIMDEILDFAKKNHALPQDEKSIFGVSLRSFYSNLTHHAYPMTKDQEKTLQKIQKYTNYRVAMTLDIISYYQEHHELPPIGTKNDLGEDIGAFYSDFEHSNFDSTMIKYFQMYQVPYRSKRETKKDELIEQLLTQKNDPDYKTDPELYHAKYVIETGRLKLNEVQQQKLVDHGIIPNSRERKEPIPRTAAITEKEKTALLKEVYQYLLLHEEVKNVRFSSDKRIFRLLNFQYILNEEQENIVRKIHALLEKRKHPCNEDLLLEEKQTEKIKFFVDYVTTYHQMPWYDRELMNFIQACATSEIKINFEQYRLLKKVLPMDGSTLRQTEQTKKISEVVRILKENDITKNHLIASSSVLPYDLFLFFKKVLSKKVTLTEKQIQQLQEINIDVSGIPLSKKEPSPLSENVFLLRYLTDMQEQLERLHQQMDSLVEKEQKLLKLRERKGNKKNG